MPVICQICQRAFDKIITSSHLSSHGILTADYRSRYGNDSIASPEYRAQRSAERSGDRNPMHGRTHSDGAKRQMSESKIGSIPHNRGVKVTDPEELSRRRASIAAREKTYQVNGNHPRKGVVVTEETRAKISAGVKRYAKQNPTELAMRVKKVLKSKKDSGYFGHVKDKTLQRFKDRWTGSGYEILTVDDHYIATIRHSSCDTVVSRNLKSMFNERACTRCYPQPSVSKAEQEIANWLESDLGLSIIRNDTTLLGKGFEIDMVIPDHKICIEYNGLYWHSEQGGKSRWYHVNKMNHCQKVGYRLIQIFEDEWIHSGHLVKSRLSSIFQKNPKTVGARQCDLRSITPAVSRQFHVLSHLQGAGNGIKCYGLYHNGSLIAAMDFNRLSRSKGQIGIEGTWELTRFSSIGHVAGGASRLIQAFIRDHDPKIIISYSDLRWNTGRLYSLLGFKHIGRTTPGYWYVKGNARYHRYGFRKDKLVTQGHDPSLTENQIMENLGYLKIWDCGHDKWEWTKSTPIC